MVRRGVVQVMEGRHCFAHLSIEENLLTAPTRRKDGKAAVAQTLEKVYAYFPRLKTRRSSQAAYTSGGEQQMCAIGRALMANPKMVLLDEPSMGLAPQIVEEVFEIVKDLNAREGTTFLLAEQNTHMALRYADYGYILENGRVVMDGAAAALRENEDVKEFLPRHRRRRSEELQGREELPPAQAPGWLDGVARSSEMSNEDFFALPAFRPAEALLTLKRNLRDLRSLAERGAGRFELQGQVVLELTADETKLHARLVKRPLAQPRNGESRECRNAAEVRRLLDEVRRRVALWTDETP